MTLRLSFALLACAACAAEPAPRGAGDPPVADPISLAADAGLPSSPTPTAPAPATPMPAPTPTTPAPRPEHLPVIVVDTAGAGIGDDKTAARMYVVEDHDGSLDGIDQRPRSYDGDISIAIRGNSSRGNPKRSFSVETHDAAGGDVDAALLDLPAESDWVLYAPYNDKTLLRDKLVYDLGRALGRYAPRSRFVELLVDGGYQGVYVLIEKIKRGPSRVDLPKPASSAGADLTGGYVIKREGSGETDADGRRTGWRSRTGFEWDFHDPKASKVSAAQRGYLIRYVDELEAALEPRPDFADASTGYPHWIDVPSFVDYVIVTELTKNVDGYRKSAYFAKDRDRDGGRLHAGPFWDYNLALGNADYCGGERTDGFQFERDPDLRGCGDELEIAPWWATLMADPDFADAVRCRWQALRGDLLSDDHLAASIDAYRQTLAEPEARDDDLWQTIGTQLWPNPVVFDTYDGEVDYLKRWLTERAAWLDDSLPGRCP